MNRQDLYVLRTHKYNPDYADLDDQERIGVVTWDEDPTMKPVHDLDDCGAKRLFYIARVESTAPKDDIISALHDLVRHGCSCEHDCCGHYHGGAEEIIDRHPIYLITAVYAPNY